MSDVRDSKWIRKLLSANQCAEPARSVRTKGEGGGRAPQSSLSHCAGFQSGSSGVRRAVHAVLRAHLLTPTANAQDASVAASSTACFVVLVVVVLPQLLFWGDEV